MNNKEQKNCHTFQGELFEIYMSNSNRELLKSFNYLFGNHFHTAISSLSITRIMLLSILQMRDIDLSNFVLRNEAGNIAYVKKGFKQSELFYNKKIIPVLLTKKQCIEVVEYNNKKMKLIEKIERKINKLDEFELLELYKHYTLIQSQFDIFVRTFIVEEFKKRNINFEVLKHYDKKGTLYVDFSSNIYLQGNTIKINKNPLLQYGIAENEIKDNNIFKKIAMPYNF